VRSAPETWLVDGHVHFYRCYDRALFFDSAFINMEQAKQELGISTPTVSCLCLTEAKDHFVFRQWRNEAERPSPDRWTLSPTSDALAIVASHGSKERFLVLAGRQVATREGLEVLAIGCDRDIPDGQSVHRTLAQVIEADALPVVPWGFGKWWWSRGTLLANLIASAEVMRFFLGDSAGRLRGAWRPMPFRLAESRGIWTLPGSDPLPFASHARRPGRYGFLLQGRLTRDRPSQSLKNLLRTLPHRPDVFGRRAGVVDFCRSQVAMQWRKHAHPATPVRSFIDEDDVSQSAWVSRAHDFNRLREGR